MNINFISSAVHLYLFFPLSPLPLLSYLSSFLFLHYLSIFRSPIPSILFCIPRFLTLSLSASPSSSSQGNSTPGVCHLTLFSVLHWPGSWKTKIICRSHGNGVSSHTNITETSHTPQKMWVEVSRLCLSSVYITKFVAVSLTTHFNHICS